MYRNYFLFFFLHCIFAFFFFLLDIDQLITISGMVIRTSSLIPEMREAFFQCNVCHGSTTVEIDRGRIAEPTLCTHCNTKFSYQMIHNRSQFSDKQMVKMQESPGKTSFLLSGHIVRHNTRAVHSSWTHFLGCEKV